MPGAMSIHHIPKAQGDIGEIHAREGLFGSMRDEQPDPKSPWFEQRRHDACRVEMLLHRYPDADRAGKEYCRKTINALENNIYWDTGRPCDS